MAKTTFCIIVIFLLCLGAAAILLKPYANRQISYFLENAVPDSKAEFEAWQIKWPLEFKLLNARIQSLSLDVRLPALRVAFNWEALSRKIIPIVVFENPLITIKLNKASDSASSLAEFDSKKAKNAFVVRKLRIQNLECRFHAKDLQLTAFLSLTVDLIEQKILSAELRIPSLQYQNLKINDVELVIPENKLGRIQMSSVQYQKLKIPAIQGELLLDKQVLRISNVEALLFNGKLSGDFVLRLEKRFPISGSVLVSSLQLESILSSFELNKKIDANGTLIGTIKINGFLDSLDELGGTLEVNELGGNLIIQDPVLLEDLAKNTKQPLALIEASFKEYHFDKGSAKFGKNAGDLGMEIHLDGPKGKRDLNVQLHDLFT